VARRREWDGDEWDGDMSEPTMSASYAQRVGERLRLIRKQKNLSLQDVEASSQQEFKASVLGAYERGERAISVPRLQRLAKYYNVPVDQLLPTDPDDFVARDDSVIDLTNGEASPARPARRVDDDRVSIDLTRLHDMDGSEREMLTRYLGMIQVQRQDFNGKVLTIRSEDLRAIACLFDTTTDSMRRRLDELGLRR
jgi:transcriptional regulator with XRE-family HTH domain